MDCNNAARTIQAFDYETFKMAYAPTNAAFLQVQEVTYPFYDGERWVWEGGRSGGWSWDPDPTPGGTWYFKNVELWNDCDPTWNGRHIGATGEGVWVHGGTWAFFELAGQGSHAPATC
jgi:hypothetical protein